MLRELLIGRAPDLDARLWRLAGGAEGTPAPRVAPDELRRLFALARVQGVLGLILPRAPAADADLAALAGRIRRAEIARSAGVRRHTGLLVERLAAAGVPAMVVGGTDFADRLHEDPRARPTLAVDLLVPRERWQVAAGVLVAEGHAEAWPQPPMHGRAGTAGDRVWTLGAGTAGHRAWTLGAGTAGNRAWTLGAGAPVQVTLHWNLVGDPRFRGSASVELGHLDRGPDGAPTPADRLVIAAVLAAFRHRFDRLFLLTDLARAVRRCDDVPAARALVARTGTAVAMDAGLGLAAEILADRAPEALRRELFGTGTPAVPRAVVAEVRDRLRSAGRPWFSWPRLRLRRWLLHGRVRSA